jgi:hypothetical protein
MEFCSPHHSEELYVQDGISTVGFRLPSVPVGQILSSMHYCVSFLQLVCVEKYEVSLFSHYPS